MKTGILAGALALLLIFSGIAAAIETYEPYSTATGRYVTPAEWLGGPWYHSNTGGIHFGDGKQAYIKYFTNTSRVTVGGKDFGVLGNLYVGGSETIGGTQIINGVIATKVYMNGGLDLGAASPLRSQSAIEASTLVSNGSISGTTAYLTALYNTGNSQTFGTSKVGGKQTVNQLASNGTIVGTTISGAMAYLTGLYNTGNSQTFGSSTVGGLSTVNSLTVNTTETLNGPLIAGSTASATNDTLTSASKTQYLVGAATGQRIALPAVATTPGLKFTFTLVTASTGSHLFVLDPSGAETINGGATLSCATKYASISVYDTGTEWVATSVGQVGTWAIYAGV